MANDIDVWEIVNNSRVIKAAIHWGDSQGNFEAARTEFVDAVRADHLEREATAKILTETALRAATAEAEVARLRALLTADTMVPTAAVEAVSGVLTDMLGSVLRIPALRHEIATRAVTAALAAMRQEG